MDRPESAPVARAQFSAADRLFEALAPLGQRRRHATGSVVVREGEPSASLFLVFSGALRATMAGSGERIIELNAIGPGEIFGELSLGLLTRTATVEVTATAQLGEVSRADAKATLLQRPELALELLENLISRIGFLTQRVRGLVTLDVYGRMVDLFASLAIAEDGRAVLQRLTQQAIAERIGASRGMVNKLLHDLLRGGYLEIEPDRIVLLRPLPRHW
jgi:CRP/FNR family transcriptional regulator, cyclic AMP receptor protein